MKKKFVETLDKIFNCCIFALSLKIKQDNKTKINSNNKKTK